MTTTISTRGLHADLLMQAQELVHVGVWAWDVATDTICWSDELFRLVGLEPQSLSLQFSTYLSFVHPEDRDRVGAIIGEALAAGTSFRFDNRLITGDGRLVHHHARGSILRDPSGAARQMIGTCIDITDRVQQQETLRASEERFRSVFEQSAVGLALTDSSGRFLSVNPSFARLLGFAPAELQSKSFMDITHPDDVESTREMMRHTGASPASFTYEKRYVRKDQTIVWARATVTRLRSEDGSLDGYMGVIEDITERNQLQQRLAQAQKMEALGQLAGGIAHDFNNLLTVISGYAVFLLDSLGDDRRASEDVKEILSTANRATALTRQLLAFSRRQLLKPEIVDANLAVQDLGRTLGRLIGEHIELAIVPAAAKSTVEADSHQLEQVLLNLVVNARDAIKDEGTITIETSNRRLASADGDVDYVAISVTDDGSGIEPAALDRIFEPFYTTKPVGKGTGLGLATVHGIVEQSGWRVEVESELGRGTTFHVLLPVVHGPSYPCGTRSGDEATGGSETLLLVEDEAALRAVMRRVLVDLGYTVLEARHGGDAARLSAAHPGAIDLLITDIVMPVLGGRELARLVREHHPDVPVLYVSGYTDDELLRKGILEPGAQLLRKPFMPAELGRAVRDLLREGADSIARAPGDPLRSRRT